MPKSSTNSEDPTITPRPTCLPEPLTFSRRNTLQYTPWPTVNYTLAAVRHTITTYGGDPQRVVVLGHSRGAIATQAIAGFNDEVGDWMRYLGC